MPVRALRLLADCTPGNFSVDVCEGLGHGLPMTNGIRRAPELILDELRLMVAVLAANVDMLGFLVRDLLEGDEEDLLPDADRFAVALDKVLFHGARAARNCLDALRDLAPNLSPDLRAQLPLYAEQFIDITHHWTELVTAVNGIWKLRRPPH